MEDKFPIGDFVGVCVLGIEVGVWGGVDSCGFGFDGVGGLSVACVLILKAISSPFYILYFIFQIRF